MDNVHCKKDTSLTKEEKEVFTGHLEQEGLSYNIWDLFEEWVERSTSKVKFFYLKVYKDENLIGLGLFSKIKPFDLTTSYYYNRNFTRLYFEKSSNANKGMPILFN
ncbi:hypothetical protein MHK_005538 [Candidatus Magnetomorum sp. HK-1]|nr:hypothetical protein MHK_005538 [Candidatus Magnetomorum sp. HK-1]